MTKSAAKINMERSLLEAIYWMSLESLDPKSFENIDNIITQLHETRNLGIRDQ